MVNAIVDVDALTAALSPDFGTVKLIPGLKMGATEPSSLPSTVSVMTSFELVAKKKYRFGYNWYRFLRLGYLLERDGKWESGEFHIISKGTYQKSIDINSYSYPNLYTAQTTMYSDSSLGVELGVMKDPSKTNTEPMFGISYKITTATPNKFPTLRMYLIKALPLYEKPQED